MESELADHHDLELLNLSREEIPRGGNLTMANIWRTVVDVSQVWAAARDHDVAHIHSALAPGVTVARAGLLAAAARTRGARVLLHAHSGKVELWLRGSVRRGLARIALAPVDRTVAVSEGSRRALAETLGNGRVTLQRNWVDTRMFSPRRARRAAGGEPVRVLYAGVVSARKGLLDLFAASRILSERGVGHEVVVAGGVPDEGPRFAAEVRSGAPPGVRFLGPQPRERMPSVYRKADVFCLPSWWEAFPLSLLEAMACGLPVVATGVGDVPVAVRDGQTGFLVRPREPVALAGALERLVTDPEARRAMGKAGRQRAVRDFGARRGRGALDDLYRERTGEAKPSFPPRPRSPARRSRPEERPAEERPDPRENPSRKRLSEPDE